MASPELTGSAANLTAQVLHISFSPEEIKHAQEVLAPLRDGTISAYIQKVGDLAKDNHGTLTLEQLKGAADAATQVSPLETASYSFHPQNHPFKVIGRELEAKIDKGTPLGASGATPPAAQDKPQAQTGAAASAPVPPVNGGRRTFDKAAMTPKLSQDISDIYANKATHEEVEEVQKALIAQHFDVGTFGEHHDGVDGIAGDYTKRAMSEAGFDAKPPQGQTAPLSQQPQQAPTPLSPLEQPITPVMWAGINRVNAIPGLSVNAHQDLMKEVVERTPTLGPRTAEQVIVDRAYAIRYDRAKLDEMRQKGWTDSDFRALASTPEARQLYAAIDSQQRQQLPMVGNVQGGGGFWNLFHHHEGGRVGGGHIRVGFTHGMHR